VAFEVSRKDFRATRFAAAPLPTESSLAVDAALLAVDEFGLTANNVTYALVGDSFGYFSFFPASGGDGWGRVPAWGFATVVASRNAAVPVGMRVFGYVPMASHVVLQLQGDKGQLFDVTEHRKALPPIYNRYEVVSGHDADRDARRALLQPLFGTAFLLDDWLASEQFFGARRIILTSASSKTSTALATLLSWRKDEGVTVVGLTSPGNRAFVESLGVYDEVVPYDAIDGLPLEPAVSVDMAGSLPVLSAVHHRLRERLTKSVRVGSSHWEAEPAPFAGGGVLPGPAPEFFFAPTRAEQRVADWGPAAFRSQLAAALARYFQSTRGGFLTVQRGRGEAAVDATFRQLLDGKVPPSVGHVLSLSVDAPRSP
jgi:hypothetical protein